MKRSISKFAAAGFFAGAALLGAGVVVAQQKTISIATGGTGGVYYPMGGGLANMISKHIPGTQATAEVTGGSVDNLKLIGSKRAEVAFSQVDAAVDAVNGKDKFTAGKVPLRTLLVLYPNRMHVVTVEGTGVNKMSDLKGKRVSTGSPGSATEVFAFRVIEAAGLDKDKDMTRERLSVAESVNAVKDGKIAAFFWVGGIPTAAVTDLGATPGVKIKMIDTADLVKKMNEKYDGVYSTDTIKKGAYPGQDKDNPVSVVQNILVAHESMPDDLAYNLVKMIIEKKPELVAAHKEADSISLDIQKKANSASVPWHPGALKYLKEKGVTP